MPSVGGKRTLWLAAPVAASCLAGPTTQGSVIYVNLGAGMTITRGQDLFWEMGGGASYANFAGTDFRLRLYPLSYPNPDPTVSPFGAGDKVADPGYYAAKIVSGSPINGSLSFTGFTGLPLDYGVGPWTGGANAYLGLLVGGTDYGWAHINYISDTSITLLGYAYENTGGSINAGQVPEPVATGVVGAVLAGSATAWAARRKRKQAHAA